MFGRALPGTDAASPEDSRGDVLREKVRSPWREINALAAAGCEVARHRPKM